MQRTENKKGKEWTRYKYYFEREKCRNCPRREECLGKSKIIGKVLNLGENASEYYEHNQWTKTEEFKAGYKMRAKIEPKNAELKRFHGLDRARGYGLRSVSIQTKLTIIAVNLKRICKLISVSSLKLQTTTVVYLEIDLMVWKIQETTARKQDFLSGLAPSPCVFPCAFFEPSLCVSVCPCVR